MFYGLRSKLPRILPMIFLETHLWSRYCLQDVQNADNFAWNSPGETLSCRATGSESSKYSFLPVSRNAHHKFFEETDQSYINVSLQSFLTDAVSNTTHWLQPTIFTSLHPMRTIRTKDALTLHSDENRSWKTRHFCSFCCVVRFQDMYIVSYREKCHFLVGENVLFSFLSSSVDAKLSSNLTVPNRCEPPISDLERETTSFTVPYWIQLFGNPRSKCFGLSKKLCRTQPIYLLLGPACAPYPWEQFILYSIHCFQRVGLLRTRYMLYTYYRKWRGTEWHLVVYWLQDSCSPPEVFAKKTTTLPSGPPFSLVLLSTVI